MNKCDKYYLKQGKLELSLLDDTEMQQLDNMLGEQKHHIQNKLKDQQAEFIQDNNVQECMQSRTTQNDNSTLDVQDETLKEQNIVPGETKIKLTDDIYNTLHTMGQFLTKQNDSSGTSTSLTSQKEQLNEAEIEDILSKPNWYMPHIERNKDKRNMKKSQMTLTKEDVIRAKTQVEEAKSINASSSDSSDGISKELEQMISSVSRRLTKEMQGATEEQITKAVLEEVLGQEVSLAHFSKPDELVEELYQQAAEEAAVTTVPILEVEDINGTSSLQKSLNLFEEEEVDYEMTQADIDELFVKHFGVSKSRFDDMIRLKAHINKKIDEIKNYV